MCNLFAYDKNSYKQFEICHLHNVAIFKDVCMQVYVYIYYNPLFSSIYIYIYIYMPMYIYRNIYKCVFMYVFTDVFAFLHSYEFIYIYIYVCFSFVHVCINVCVYTYVYPYMHVCMWVCIYVYACACGSISVHSLRVIIPLSSLRFQGIHQQLHLTTLSVMFFPRSFGVLGLLTSYTSTKVTQLVLISHQLVVRNLTAAKKKITKTSMGLYRN